MEREARSANRPVVRSCRLTLAEDKEVKEAARQEGLSITDLMRKRILRDSAAAGGN